MIVQTLRKEGYKLKHLLPAIGISRPTYYYEIKKTDVVAERNKDFLDEIKDIFTKNKDRYGVRRAYQELIQRGHTINYKRV